MLTQVRVTVIVVLAVREAASVTVTCQVDTLGVPSETTAFHPGFCTVDDPIEGEDPLDVLTRDQV